MSLLAWWRDLWVKCPRHGTVWKDRRTGRCGLCVEFDDSEHVLAVRHGRVMRVRR